MSFKDGEMQTISVLGAVVISVGLFAPVLYLTEKADAAKTKFDDMESIEASVAYKKEKQKQPQKQTSQPEVKKDTTVSHDENKKPIEGCKLDSECKPDEKCKEGHCVAKKEPKDKPVAFIHLLQRKAFSMYELRKSTSDTCKYLIFTGNTYPVMFLCHCLSLKKTTILRLPSFWLLFQRGRLRFRPIPSTFSSVYQADVW